MPSISAVCKLTIDPSTMTFHVRNNDCEIHIGTVTVSQEDAATLAWLLSSADNLEIRVKVAN